MNSEQITSLTNKISAWVVLTLAILGFVLSYNALWELSHAHGMPYWAAWIWPLLIDLALIVFSVAVVRAYLLKESAGWPWFLVGLTTVATVVFNIVHAGEDSSALSIFGLLSIDLKYLVAVVPPLCLVLSFETLMTMLRNNVRRAGLVDSLSELSQKISKRQRELTQIEQDKRQELDNIISQKQAEINNLQANALNLEANYEANRQELDGQIETMKRTIETYRQDIEAKKEELKRLDQGPTKAYVPSGLTIEQRQELVSQMEADRLTNEQIAGLLGVSLGTVKNDKRAAKEASLVNTNGKGE